MGLNLKALAKRAALRSVNSPLGSGDLLTRAVLRGMKVQLDREHLKSGGGERSGTVVVSVDFDVTQPSRFANNQKGTRALVELAEKHGIPITWAICGMTAEADVPSYNAILDCKVKHEIGVHTYSHIDATTSSKEQFSSDIDHCIRALDLESPRTFVFPWNRENPFDVLREFGFRAYRGRRRVVGVPVKHEGLWNMPPVYYFDGKSAGSETLIEAYVDLCASRSAFFHLWTHPWALSTGGDLAPSVKTLDEVFAYIARLRSEGKLSAMLIGENALLLDRSDPPIAEGSNGHAACPEVTVIG